MGVWHTCVRVSHTPQGKRRRGRTILREGLHLLSLSPISGLSWVVSVHTCLISTQGMEGADLPPSGKCWP